MSMLVDYARRVAETKGIQHKTYLSMLRSYIKATPEKYLIPVIKQISNPNVLRALWEAGLNSTLQEAVAERLSELAEARG